VSEHGDTGCPGIPGMNPIAMPVNIRTMGEAILILSAQALAVP